MPKTAPETLFGASGLTAIAGSLVTIGLKLAGVDITEFEDPNIIVWRHDTMTWMEVGLHVTSLGALLGWVKKLVEKELEKRPDAKPASV